jgi:dTDP-4-dehydrorhamnose 3,5-epimerase
MRITETALSGLFVVDITPFGDERGHFARTFCAEEFARAGLPTTFVQCSTSFNRRQGTLRGLHYQDDPCPEGKLVRCTRGAAFDVAVDLRPGSPSYCRWHASELTADNTRALYIPPGFAHGFQTLADGTEILYQMTEFYRADLARGVRWNDPSFGIDWPLSDPILSPRDAGYPEFRR